VWATGEVRSVGGEIVEWWKPGWQKQFR
jgi:hypothetical protein